jgi:hypothetical protein
MTPFDKIGAINGKYEEDALKVAKEYIGLCQEFGLVSSRVKEDVEGREVSKVTAVKLANENSVIISFEFEGIAKTYQLSVHRETYNNLVDPEKYPSNWKYYFFEETSKFLEKKVDEKMAELGKWLERVDKVKKYMEKESEN